MHGSTYSILQGPGQAWKLSEQRHSIFKLTVQLLRINCALCWNANPPPFPRGAPCIRRKRSVEIAIDQSDVTERGAPLIPASGTVFFLYRGQS